MKLFAAFAKRFKQKHSLTTIQTAPWTVVGENVNSGNLMISNVNILVHIFHSSDDLFVND